mmetsp:Transcript_30770/g.36234  ORF Transcript_30770/g.36234 Transcript_30770/m.36234 type:complete len:250 (+) Transcript_30770:141-890(+)
MVDEWRSRESEDGFPIPTIVEELVEKNGLAAALNHGWWNFVGEFVLMTAPVPRWREVVAHQLQASRIRLHSDVRGTSETRAGGFLCPGDPKEEETHEDPSVSLFSPSRSLNPEEDFPLLSNSVNSDENEKNQDGEEGWFCCCGTCSQCQLRRARSVPQRLYLPHNNALGPEKTKLMAKLDHKQKSSTYMSQCIKHLSDTCKLILKENPIFSDDQVRRYILQGDDQILKTFHEEHPAAFASFTDRRLSHK